MKQVGIREVHALLARVEDVLAVEGELIVTNRGRAVARLVPMPKRRLMPSHADHRAKMPSWETGSEALLRDDRERR